MPGVKQSRARQQAAAIITAAAGFVALQGCESGDLARFAPPGVIKYEEIASEKPQNPEVAARIAERRAEPGSGRYPNLSEAPGAGDRPKKRKAADVEGEMSELAVMRDGLDAAVDSDRAAAAEELAEDLTAGRDALQAQIEQDEAAAARERREQLKAPDSDN